jgi:uncharacterized phage-like protein YoqJ
MSVNAYGKFDQWVKANLLITIGVHIHEIQGTLGYEHWCLECVKEKRNDGRPQKKSRK